MVTDVFRHRLLLADVGANHGPVHAMRRFSNQCADRDYDVRCRGAVADSGSQQHFRAVVDGVCGNRDSIPQHALSRVADCVSYQAGSRNRCWYSDRGVCTRCHGVERSDSGSSRQCQLLRQPDDVGHDAVPDYRADRDVADLRQRDRVRWLVRGETDAVSGGVARRDRAFAQPFRRCVPKVRRTICIDYRQPFDSGHHRDRRRPEPIRSGSGQWWSAVRTCVVKSWWLPRWILRRRRVSPGRTDAARVDTGSRHAKRRSRNRSGQRSLRRRLSRRDPVHPVHVWLHVDGNVPGDHLAVLRAIRRFEV